MNIGIVGGNGFLGKKLIEELVVNDENFLILFQRSKSFININNYKNVKVVYESELENLLDEKFSIDVLYYLASDSIPFSSWNDPILEIEKNIIPFIKYVQFSVNHGLKKIIYTSSAGTIYGASKKNISEKKILKPHSPYGITKATIEYYLEYFRKLYGVNFDVFRISNVYGPGQDTSKGLGLINTILGSYLSKSTCKIYGDGENIRNYIFVDDVVNVLSLTLTSNHKSSGIYNLCSDENHSINEIISLIEISLNIKLTIDYLPKRKSDNPFIRLSNKKIKIKYPTLSFTSLEQGIQDTFKFLHTT